MSHFDEQMLREEVQDWTDLLRNDPRWEDTRKAFSRKGFSVNEVLLAAFMEDEVGGEYGAFVTLTGDVYEYERDTRPGASFEFTKLRHAKNPARVIKMNPAVEVALRMIAPK